MSEHATMKHGGRLAAEVLRAHGIDVVFTLSGGHLFVALRRLRPDRPRTRRHAARADRDLRGRRVREGHRPARLRGADRRTRSHQRRQRARVRRGSRARRCSCIGGRAPQGRWGRGLAPGARPRPDRRPGHEDRGDRELRRRHGVRAARRAPRRAYSSSRSDLRRPSARRVRPCHRRHPGVRTGRGGWRGA